MVGVGRVEVVVEAQTNAKFVRWLYSQLCEEDRVAAPDGECEAFGFGAVNPLPGGLTLPWGEFESDPVRAVAPMFRRGCPKELEPVVLAEYGREGHTVRLRWGRHVPTTRATAGAVLLG